MKDVDIVRGMDDGSIPHPEGKESDDIIKLELAKTLAMVAIHDEGVAIDKLIAKTGVTDEVRRRFRFLEIMSAFSEVVARNDLSIHKNRVAARKKRSTNAKVLDPIYQKTADFVREKEPWLQSKRKIADKVHAHLEDLMLKGKLKIKKLDSAETIRKHIK